MTPAQCEDQDPLPGLSAAGDTQSEPTAGKMKAQPAIINMLLPTRASRGQCWITVYQENFVELLTN